MNFDRLAGYYHGLETILAGTLMQRCRTMFLARTGNSRRALLLGEGTGKFLTELLRVNPQVQVVCVEHSGAMIRQIQERLTAAEQDVSRVEFRQMDALHWTPATEKFDLVVTNFFLDCFNHEQLQQLVPQLAGSTTDDALWLLADFCVPAHGWRRWRAEIIIALLYTFFRLTTSLSARRLTPPDPLLTRSGFGLQDRRLISFGLTHADLWQRTHPCISS